MTKKAEYICRRTVFKRYNITQNQLTIACDENIVSIQLLIFKNHPWNVKFKVEDLERSLEKIRSFPRDEDSEEMRRFDRIRIEKLIADASKPKSQRGKG